MTILTILLAWCVVAVLAALALCALIGAADKAKVHDDDWGVL